jgi:hypothetical protein
MGTKKVEDVLFLSFWGTSRPEKNKDIIITEN